MNAADATLIGIPVCRSFVAFALAIIASYLSGSLGNCREQKAVFHSKNQERMERGGSERIDLFRYC